MTPLGSRRGLPRQHALGSFTTMIPPMIQNPSQVLAPIARSKATSNLAVRLPLYPPRYGGRPLCDNQVELIARVYWFVSCRPLAWLCSAPAMHADDWPPSLTRRNTKDLPDEKATICPAPDRSTPYFGYMPVAGQPQHRILEDPSPVGAST